MKIFSKLLAIVTAIIAIIFTLSNRAEVTVSLWPFDVTVSAPLGLIVLGVLLVGMLVGATVVWLSMIPHKMLSRRLRREVSILETKFDELQKSVMTRRAPYESDAAYPTQTRLEVLEAIRMTSPIFCAIDTPDLDRAEKLAAHIKPYVGGLKLGLEFFLAHGTAGYHRMAQMGLPIFLDLKLHDIPNTVAGAVRSLLPLQPAFTTIHASGGAAMMRAAKAQAGKVQLLAVTLLTSLDGDDLAQVGQGTDTTQQVLRLAKLAQANGMDGVICSPEEIRPLRAALGNDFILMVPGIRPTWAAAQDQKRTLTPREAMQEGATYLVIGRPITGAENPAEAARRVMEEM